MVKLIDFSVCALMVIGGLLFVVLLGLAVIRLVIGLAEWIQEFRQERAEKRAEKRAEYESSKMFGNPLKYIETENFFIIEDSVTGREIARLPADPSKDKRKANLESKSDQPQ